MKVAIWIDGKGYQHRGLIRDSDPPEMAEAGIPDDPPDLSELDWGLIKRDLHNLLVDRELITWHDVQRQKNGLSGAIQSVLKRRLIGLYKEKEQRERGG